MLADTEAVRYVISSRVKDIDETREFLCTVFVGDAQVVEVDGGVSQEEVKTKAAEVGSYFSQSHVSSRANVSTSFETI